LACEGPGHPPHAFLLMDGPLVISGYRFTQCVERSTSSCQHPLAAPPRHWLPGSHGLHRRCVPRHRWRPWPTAVAAPALSLCACAFRHHSKSTAFMTRRGASPRPLQAIQKDAGRRPVGRSGRIDATRAVATIAVASLMPAVSAGSRASHSYRGGSSASRARRPASWLSCHRFARAAACDQVGS